ncbi:carboxy terminal-processing peptidase [Riemerella columbipharyngis]|uniref:Carboxyl-terminal processing protease n=1 Tax=Riemerella columbipharyngis TaxID=1071918 RepID=A0A1G7CGJ2_9FLAO|nr:carboxy terminal-processing peptidase [Riemerella columbipharyngis]SDE38373.1 carboxyl-terminal processing protease [Riemerella columbipharyngis]
MFKKFRLNKLLLFIPLTSMMFCFNSPKNDDEKMMTIMVAIKNTLSYLHYNPRPINDAYSRDVYKKYFDKIDPMKQYFLKSDMDKFSLFKDKLDNYFEIGDLTFFKVTTDTLAKRVEYIKSISKEILSKPIDLHENDSLILDPKIKDYPADKKELYNEWKRFIKYNILQEVETMNSREEAKQKLKDSLNKNHLKDTITLKHYTQEQKIQKATEEIKNLMNNMFKRIQKRKEMDVFSMYMNAYTEAFDPHSNYYSPKDKEDFDVQFSGVFVGIGAVIQEKKGSFYFGPLTVGAPAWKSKELSEGDKILKVKPLPNEPAINVSGMLIEEVVKNIRGKKGTKVTLTIMKKDGTIKEITLVRDKVKIEDTFAKSIMIETPDKKKIGYIYLPGFYADFKDDKEGRNASDDVKTELEKLKKEGAQYMILDIRSNGGGSLSEVVDMMGLFTKQGPVVQVKDNNGNTQAHRNKSNNPIWTGPLLLLQNELSASASEILAQAMRDYQRAIILGSPTSFGKGTVQTFIGLNRFLNTNEDFGDLKMTIQKFYGINGESNQLKGVPSDIPLKDGFSYSEIGEKYADNALPWDKIQPTEYTKLYIPNIENIIKNSEARMATSKDYQLLLESIKWKEKLDKVKKLPLNINQFEALMIKRKKELERFKSLGKYNNGLKFTMNSDEQMRAKKDTVFAKKEKSWIKNLSRDLFLKEGTKVVTEIK